MVCPRALFPAQASRFTGKKNYTNEAPSSTEDRSRRDGEHCRPQLIRVSQQREGNQTLGKVLRLGSNIHCTSREGGTTVLSEIPGKAQLEAAPEPTGVWLLEKLVRHWVMWMQGEGPGGGGDTPPSSGLSWGPLSLLC